MLREQGYTTNIIVFHHHFVFEEYNGWILLVENWLFFPYDGRELVLRKG